MVRIITMSKSTKVTIVAILIAELIVGSYAAGRDALSLRVVEDSVHPCGGEQKLGMCIELHLENEGRSVEYVDRDALSIWIEVQNADGVAMKIFPRVRDVSDPCPHGDAVTAIKSGDSMSFEARIGSWNENVALVVAIGVRAMRSCTPDECASWTKIDARRTVSKLSRRPQ
jgi:hypothetical protein